MEQFKQLIDAWRDEARRRRRFTQDGIMAACINTLETCADELERVVEEIT